MLDTTLFVLLPYGVVIMAVVGVIYRIFGRRYIVSSLSSQFLEGRELFYGSVPWHYGILVVLTGHLIGFLLPRELLLFNSVPVRLFIIELAGLAFGLLALVGIVSLVVRRWTSPRIRAVTSKMDVVLLLILLVQVVSGVYTALFHRWGSSWYAASAVPYLWSLLTFTPDTATLAPLPWMVKVHIGGLWALIGVLPFSRLIHALVPPIMYLWRPYELVIWNRRQSRASDRRPTTGSFPTPMIRPSMTATKSRRPVEHENTPAHVDQR